MKKINILFVFCFLVFSIFFRQEAFASTCQDNSTYDDLSESCKCNAGYILNDSLCVKPSQFCVDSFGINSKYNFSTGKCECSYGYVAYSGQCVNANFYCQDILGIHSLYDFKTKSCKCEVGYIKDSSENCISQKNYCLDVLGENSEYNKISGSCICKIDYVLFNGECIQSDKYCEDLTTGNSTYNESKKACECNKGYRLINSKCSAREILGVSKGSAYAGELITINGKNLGKESEGKLLIGSYVVGDTDIISWSDEEISFVARSAMSSGNISIKTNDDLKISGPNFEVLMKKSEETIPAKDDSGKITLNQQINITGATGQIETKSPESSPTETVAKYSNSDKGIISSVSLFFGSVYNGFKNILNNFLGRS